MIRSRYTFKYRMRNRRTITNLAWSVLKYYSVIFFEGLMKFMD
jgi:hypothetical protein